MAAITWFLTNGLAGRTHQALSETSPGADATTSPTYGWVVGTVVAARYASADAQTERTSGNFGTTAQPDGSISAAASAGDCWRTEKAYHGTFAAGNWTFQMAAIAVTNGGDADGRCRFRLFKANKGTGQSIGGAVVTEITSGVQIGSTITNLTTSTQQVSSITVSLGSFSVDDEYLFVQIGWEITGVGGNANRDVIHRIGNTASLVTSADFAPTPSRQYRLPTNAFSDSSIGTPGFVWINPTNALVSDALVADNNGFGASDQSEALATDTFGFSIPADATIEGVRARYERQDAANTVSASDFDVRLRKAGAATGTNKASAATWGGPNAEFIEYGSATDLWGTTLTPTEANATGFGIGISAQDGGVGADIAVDLVALGIWFSIQIAASLTGSAAIACSMTVVTSGADVFMSATLTGNATATADAKVDRGISTVLIGTAGITNATAYVPGWPNAANSEALSGSAPWSNPSNVGSTNGAYATATLNNIDEETENLRMLDFRMGDVMGADATPHGITFTIVVSCAEGGIYDIDVTLLKGGTAFGANRVFGAELPSGDFGITYGGPNDLWGGLWSRAEIAANDFGVRFRVVNLAGTSGAHVRVDSGNIHVNASVDIAASLTGSASLTATARRDVPIAASVSGSGTIATVDRIDAALVAALAGSATVGVTDRVDWQIASAIAGNGTLTCSMTVQAAAGGDQFIAAALAGTGTIASVARADLVAASALAGAGTITAAPRLDLKTIAALSGSGTVAASGRLDAAIAAALSGTATMTSAMRVDDAMVCALAGAGTLAAAARADWVIASAMAGAGTLTCTMTVTALNQIFMAAALIGQASLTATAKADHVLSAALAGSGSVAAALRADYRISAACAGSGILASAPQVDRGIASALLGAATLAGTARTDRGVVALLSGIGSVAASPRIDMVISAALPGAGMMAASLTLFDPFLRAALAGSGTISTLMSAVYPLAAALDGSSAMDARFFVEGEKPPPPREKLPKYVLDEQRGHFISAHGKFPPW